MSELFANKQVLRSVSAAFAAFVASACLGGCPFVNQNHCAYMLEQGMASPCANDQVCSKCTPDNNGCVAPADVDDGCMLALSGTSSTMGPTTEPTGSTSPTTSTTMTTVMETTSSTTMMVMTESSTSMDTTESTTDPTTETSGTTSELSCHPDAMILDDFCDEPSKPYCVGPDTCGPCGELDDIMKSCAEVEPGKPVCHESSGRCVECTTDNTEACPVDKPGCDDEAGTCSKCTEHSQCPNTACDMKMGTCFPDDSIVWIENTANECAGGNGTELKPFCTLLAAANSLTPGKPTTIKIRPGQNGSMQPLPLASEGYVLAIVRGTATIPTLEGSANNDPMIQVSPGSRVYLSNLRIANTNGPAIVECAGAAMGAELYLDDVQVNGNGVLPAKGIDASNCMVKLRRTRIYKNRGGVQLAGGTLWAENSHFTENGSIGAPFGAFNFLMGATATITYSSIALHPVTASSNSTFNCSNAGTITIRNSAIIGPKTLSKCTLDQTTSIVVEADTQLQADQTAKNQWFTGPVEGVLRAKTVGNPPPLKDIAVWTMGDPRYDFDREPRPTVGPSWAGADEPL